MMTIFSCHYSILNCLDPTLMSQCRLYFFRAPSRPASPTTQPNHNMDHPMSQIRHRFLKCSKWVTLDAASHATSGALEHAIRLAWLDISRQDIVPEYGYLSRVVNIGVAPARPILLCRPDGNYEVEVTVVGVWTSERALASPPTPSDIMSWVPTHAELDEMADDQTRRRALLEAIYDRPEDHDYGRLSDAELLEVAAARAPTEIDV